MSTFVVLGDHPAADRLVTATLNDYLETWSVTDDDTFAFVIAVRNPAKPAIKNVIEWCDKAEVYYEIVANSDKLADKFPGAAAFEVHDNFMLKAVEDGYFYDQDNTTVLALVGEEDPKVDVTRALARAADSHMVIRDLSEGALTYIKFHGDAVDDTIEEENTMAEEADEVSLEELIALAAEGDEEAVEAINEACVEFELDPDDYEWDELEAVLAEKLSEEPAEEEADEEPAEEEAVGEWTAAALKGLTLKEVRAHATAAGIENAKTAPRPELVKALVAGTGDVEEDEPAPKKKGKKSKGSDLEDLPRFDIDELADAIIDRFIARLS